MGMFGIIQKNHELESVDSKCPNTMESTIKRRNVAQPQRGPCTTPTKWIVWGKDEQRSE